MPQIYKRLSYIQHNTEKDWFHANSIEHDVIDNSLIISGRAQCVIKITLPENNGAIQAGKDDITLKWILTVHLKNKEQQIKHIPHIQNLVKIVR